VTRDNLFDPFQSKYYLLDPYQLVFILYIYKRVKQVDPFVT